MEININKNQSIYIAGASGFLGSFCAKYLEDNGYQVLADRIDVNNFGALSAEFRLKRPDVVINFAGAKAYPNIDWCEGHKEETVALNVAGAINVMTAALEAGAYPIQISSGCIYNGGPEHFFTEEDEPNFYGSFYSRMRIVLQKALADLPVLYLRIRMPMASYPHARNTITKVASYKEVISLPNSVTLIEDMAPALEQLIKLRPVGILNLTNEGYVENKRILELYKELIDPDHAFKIIDLERLEGPGGILKARRSNCVLSTAKAKSLGIKMPALDEKRLREILVNYKTHLK